MTIRVNRPGDDSWKEMQKSSVRAWDTGEYQGEELIFASLGQLLEIITPKRWVIIDKLQQIGPSSLRGLARELQRDVKRVHQDVAVLLEEGVVERRDDGKLEVPFRTVRFSATIGNAA